MNEGKAARGSRTYRRGDPRVRRRRDDDAKAGAKIINLELDFDYGRRSSSTPGYSSLRGRNKEPQLQAQHQFPRTGAFRIARKVQDDLGGEGLWSGEIEVE